MGVIINNQNTKTLGFALKGRPNIPSSTKKYESTEVEGRDGSLTRFIGYEDLKFTLKFNILFQTDIKQKLREIKGVLAKASTLSFDDSPNFFYKIKQAQISETESVIKASGVFSVDFVAEPFEYEASSILEYTNPKNLIIRNNATYFSSPIINIQGSGIIKLTINYKLIELNIIEKITLNSALQEAYNDGINMNAKMIGDFPIFQIGENSINCEGNIEKMEITPNWRWLV